MHVLRIASCNLLKGAILIRHKNVQAFGVSCAQKNRIRTPCAMAPRVLALFDVDGTLTVPRKVCPKHMLSQWIRRTCCVLTRQWISLCADRRQRHAWIFTKTSEGKSSNGSLCYKDSVLTCLKELRHLDLSASIESSQSIGLDASICQEITHSKFFPYMNPISNIVHYAVCQSWPGGWIRSGQDYRTSRRWAAYDLSLKLVCSRNEVSCVKHTFIQACKGFLNHPFYWRCKS